MRPCQQGERATHNRDAYPHVHSRDGVVLEVLVVGAVERVVVVERHPARAEHLGQERELFRLEALVERLLLGPLLVLSCARVASRKRRE